MATAKQARARRENAGIFAQLGLVAAQVRRGDVTLEAGLVELFDGADYPIEDNSAGLSLRTALHKALPGVQFLKCEECPYTHPYSVDSVDVPHLTRVEGNNSAKDVCPSCLNSAYHSDVMGCYISMEDSIPYYATTQQFRVRHRQSSPDRVLPDYADRNLYTRNTYGCDNLNECAVSDYVMSDYPEYFDPDYDDSGEEVVAGETHPLIKGYHRSYPTQLGEGAPDGIHLGLEIEVESAYETASDIHSFVEAVHRAMPSGYAGFETDGSLDCGVEIVTGYGSLAAHRAGLKAIFDNAAVQTTLLLNVEAGKDTSGLHIHMSKAQMGPLQCLKLDKFVFSCANSAMWKTFARREGSEYACYDVRNSAGSIVEEDEEVTRAKRLVSNYRAVTGMRTFTGRDKAEQYRQARADCFDRYSALNWQKGPTVEFRMFQSALDYTVLMGSLELVRGLYSFTRDMPMRDMTWAKFFEWAEQPANISDMRDFLAYAAARKMIEFKAFHKRTPGVKKRKAMKAAVSVEAAAEQLRDAAELAQMARPLVTRMTDDEINAAGDLLRDTMFSPAATYSISFDECSSASA
jgi:hypothetical protein